MTTGEQETKPRTRGIQAPEDRRQRTRRLAQRRTAVKEALEKLEAKGVDPTKTLRQQRFRKIKMSGGDPAPEFFAKLQRQRSK